MENTTATTKDTESSRMSGTLQKQASLRGSLMRRGSMPKRSPSTNALSSILSDTSNIYSENVFEIHNRRPIHDLIERRDWDAVNKLLERKKDALREELKECTEMINNENDGDHHLDDQRNLLLYAGYNMAPSKIITKIILLHPKIVKKPDDKYRLPVHYLAEHGQNADALKLLCHGYLKSNRWPDITGRTPLHLAAAAGKLTKDAACVLCEYGTEALGMLDDDGFTPYELAQCSETPCSLEVQDVFECFIDYQECIKGMTEEEIKKMEEELMEMEERGEFQEELESIQKERDQKKKLFAADYEKRRQKHEKS